MEKSTEDNLKTTNPTDKVQFVKEGEWFFKNGNTLKGLYKQEVQPSEEDPEDLSKASTKLTW